MKCIKESEFLDYFNGELSPTRKDEVEDHIRICPECKLKFKEWREVVEVTENFVEADKKSMEIPDFNIAAITSDADTEESESDFPWIRYWLKPALAVAAVLIISLSVLFFPESDEVGAPSNNILVVQEDIWQTSAIKLNTANYSYLEGALLQEIYSDSELRDQIMAGNLAGYDQFLGKGITYEEMKEAEIQLLEKELEKMQTS